MSAGDNWHGEAIMAELLEAARQAIDETTAACVPIARGLVHGDSALLQSRIDAVPAVVRGDTVTGAFGVPDDPGYALPQELLPEPRGRAYIRPAADREFPKLADRVAARFKR